MLIKSLGSAIAGADRQCHWVQAVSGGAFVGMILPSFGTDAIQQV